MGEMYKFYIFCKFLQDMRSDKKLRHLLQMAEFSGMIYADAYFIRYEEQSRDPCERPCRQGRDLR